MTQISNKSSRINKSIVVEQMPLSKLKTNKHNARKHSKGQIKKLAESIREFGWTNPILVNAEGVIIAGHGRLAAAMLLKIKSVPVIPIEHLSDEQQRALMLADNRLGELAEWDKDILERELAELKELDLDFDLLVTGFDGLNVSFESEGTIESKNKSKGGSQDQVNTKPKQKAKRSAVKEDISPTSRPGDIFILGAHRLVCGRAFYDNDLCFQVMQGEKAQMAFTALPVTVQIEPCSGPGATKQIFFNSISGHLERDELRSHLVEGLSRQIVHCDPNAARFLLAPAITMNEVLEACNDLYPIDEIRDYGKDLLLISGPELKGLVRPGDILVEMAASDRARGHLAKEAILEASSKGDLIFDVYGSDILIACEETGRCARVIELSGAKVDALIRGWQEKTSLEARLEQTGQTFAEVRQERMAQAFDENPFCDPVLELMADEEGDV